MTSTTRSRVVAPEARTMRCNMVDRAVRGIVSAIRSRIIRTPRKRDLKPIHPVDQLEKRLLFATQLDFELLAPRGGRSYIASADDAIDVSGEVDEYQVTLASGQRLSARVLPGRASLLQPTVTITNDDGSIVYGSNSAGASGDSATVQPINLTLPGTYRINVTDSNTTSGSYRLDAFLNTYIENETEAANRNDALVNAVNLSSQTTLLQSTGRITSASGVGDGGGISDLYRFDLTSGEAFSALLSLPNAGFGQFAFEEKFTTPGGRVYVSATGDFNNDGLDDIVLGGEGTSTTPVQVLVNDGEGGFTPYNWGGVGTVFDLVVGDFNEDGNLDIASIGTHYTNYYESSNDDGRLTIYYGDGNGQAAYTIDYWLPSAAYTLATGDVNNDDHLDLAVGMMPYNGGSETDGLIAVMLGDGTGGFATPKYETAYGRVYDIAIVDFNNDGYGDLLSGEGSTSGFDVSDTAEVVTEGWIARYFMSDENDGYVEFSVTDEFSNQVLRVAGGQLNGSGGQDYLGIFLDTYDVSVTLTDENGFGSTGYGFQLQETYINYYTNIQLADVNRDGFLDLLSSSGDYSPSDRVVLNKNDGGGFLFAGQYYYDQMGSNVGPFALGDFNADEDLDLVGISTDVQYDGSGDASELTIRDGIGEVTFDLLDSEGNAIIFPTGSGYSADRGILDYVATQTAPVYLRVTGDKGQTYQIAMSAGAKFGLDPELIDDRSQDITAARQVASRINWNSEIDVYTINLAAGDSVTGTIRARNIGPGAPNNSLVPMIELIDADNNTVAADFNSSNFDNATFNFAATVAGTYKVRITAKSGEGDYDLLVEGNNGVLPEFNLRSSNPADGTTVGYRPWIFLEFTRPVLFSSVQPTDILVNGQPASAVYADGGYRVYFNTGDLFPVDDEYDVTIPAGAILSTLGQPLPAQAFSFTVDAYGPKVTQSNITNGTVLAPGAASWDVAFDEGIVDVLFNEYFFQQILGTNDILTTNLSTGQTVNVSQIVQGAQDENYHPTELSFKYTNLAEGLYEGRLISGGSSFFGRGQNGTFDLQPLDGEYSGTLPSGDGNSGGDFVVNFAVDAPGVTALTALTARSPVGSLVHEFATTRALHATGDVDAFSISLDANQQITVMLVPNGGSASAKLDLFDPSGASLASASGAGGESVILQSVAGTTGGTYRIDATSLNGMAGYTLRVIINAAAENELVGAGNNNTRAAAQQLSMRTIASGFPGVRSAVVGDATSGEDFYRIDLTSNQAASIALSGLEGGAVEFRLEDAAGNLLTRGAGGQGNADRTAVDFLPSSTGAYYIVVSGSGRYNLMVTRQASYERETNIAPATPQDLSLTKQIVGNLKGGIPSSAAIDVLQIAPTSPTSGGNLDLLIDQLNDDTYYNFSAVRKTVADVLSYDSLQDYDVVVLTQLTSSNFTPGLASALKKYVELGGAVVVMGSIAWQFNAAVMSPFAPLLPYPTTGNFTGVGGNLAGVGTHPITSGYVPMNFPVSVYSPPAVLSGATVVASNGASPTIVVRENVGFGGRTMFMGPEYGYQYSAGNLRTGEADKLLEQALAWAANSGDQSDVFSLPLTAGNTIVLTTSTPTGETALPVNLLDPVLELYDPSGLLVASNDNGPDGRNSRIAYTPTTTGTFKVIVRAKDTDGGAYTLQATGLTGSTLVIPPQVVETSPSTTPVANAPTTLDIIFSENLLASTVQPGDLSLPGGTVSAAELLDGRTVRFTVNLPNVDTTYAYSIAGGAFTDLQGDLSEAYASTITVDRLGPYVVSSNPASQGSSPFTEWSFTFSEELAGLPTSYNYSDFFEITTPSGNLLPSWFVDSISIDGNTFTIRLEDQTAAGNYSIVLKPGRFKDLRGNLMDQDRDGNNGESTEDVFYRTIVLASPNLVVDNVQVLDTPVFGSPVTVQWTVRNSGTDPASDGWQDRLYLSTDGTVDGGDLILLTIGTPTVPLAPGQTYTRTQTVNLPLNVSVTPGNYQFLVRTDRANSQQESNENDNVTASAVTPVALPSLPDLAVSNVSLVSPLTPASGGPATIQWTLTNSGTQTISGVIRDRVSLSADAVVGSDTNLGEFDYAVSLAPGQSVTRSAIVNLPVNQYGQRWFAVSTDIYNQVFEHTNETNNHAISAPVNITLSPVPDLVVTAIDAPTNAVSGTTQTIHYTLTNNGSADFSGTIYESIYLSKDGVVGDDDLFKNVSFTGTVQAGQSITRTETITIPISYSGNVRVVVTTDVYNNVFEDVGESNNTTMDDGSIDIVLPPTPDLIVSSITAPATAQSGKSVPIQWNITNQGAAPITGTFVENVYLSPDGLIGNDQVFGQFTFTGTIPAGTTITRSQTIQLPNIYEGTYRVVVMTDAGNQIFENTDEGNNTSIDDVDLVISQSPFPNLNVSHVEAPPTAASEETIDISWRVTNNGAASTSALAWYDRVYLSADAVFDSTDVVLATVQNASYLNAGESYAQSATVTLPRGLQGDYYFFVVTDVHNQVFEYAPPASAETDNRDVSGTLQITLSPPPDLRVTNVVGPVVAFSGAISDVAWTVRNDGLGGTRAGETQWRDQVWLSTDQTIGIDDVILGNFIHTGGLAAGGSYNASGQVRLPIGISGNYYFLVRTDMADQVFEDAFESNNTTSETSATEVLLAAPPDLAVTSLTSPTAGTAGRSIAVQYTVRNDGASVTPTPGWQDRVYLSPTPTLESETAIYLGLHSRYGILQPGQSYDVSLNLTLPLNLSGTYYVFVATDSQNNIFELDNANNIVGSVNTLAVTQQFADLQISNFAPPATAEAGTVTPFSWTILNAGTDDTIVSSWTDRLFLSSDNVYGNGDDFQLVYHPHVGLLGPGESYTRVESIAIPQAVAAGQYFLFLATDYSNQVYETDDSNNNNAAAQTTIVITRQTPDLQVTNVTTPSSATSRQSASVSYTVQNLGTAATQATHWIDEIWLTRDTTIGTDDVLLSEIQRSGSLAINESYTVNRSVSLPDVTGDYHIVVRTDRSNQVVEGALDGNNDRASAVMPISLQTLPDLTVTNVSAPASTFSGQTTSISWTVTNSGNDLLSGFWYDTVYLSQDTVLDRTDTAVGTHQRNAPLGAGSSYTPTMDVTLPPGLSGEYYFIVSTDNTNRIYERDRELNNVGYNAGGTDLVLQPPVDLVAGQILVPINGTPGQNATIQYTVTNNSAQAAQGRWVDSLYLSSDQTWDIHDKLFTRYNAIGTVAPGASYSPTVTAPLPGVTPGEYYLIVRSDILNQIPEDDEINNLSASLNSVSLDVPALTLDTPTAGTLAQNQGVYYRVTVPEGETLLIDLDAVTTTGSTQLFVKHGDVPTRSSFDFGYSGALTADQKITVPKTKAGTYYILAYGDSLAAPTNYSIEARILQFEVIDTHYGIGGNGGKLTLQINGAKFDRTIVPTLVSPGGSERAASQVFFNSTTRMYATFDLTGLTPNAYDVKLTKSTSETVVVPDALSVVGAQPAQASPVIFSPTLTMAGALFQFTVSWGNDGINDIPAPYLAVGADRPIGQSAEFINDSQYAFLGIGQDDGPIGTLRPDQTSQREFYTRNGPRGTGVSLYADRMSANPDAAFDWEDMRDLLQPPDYADEDFDQAFNVMVAAIGPTWGDYLQAISESASQFPQSMGQNYLGSSLLQIPFRKAAASINTSISGRLFAADISVRIGDLDVTAINTSTGERFSTTSLNDGTYVFDRVTPGEYEIAVESSLLTTGGTLSVANNEHVVNHQVNIERGAAISGVVRNSDGDPIEGAIVSIVSTSGTIVVADTDAGGNYRIDGLIEGVYTAFADAGGFARAKATGLSLAADGQIAQNFDLDPQAVISGTISSAVGPSTPISVIARQLPLPSGEAGAFKGVLTGNTFTLPNLPAGQYEVSVVRSGYVTATTTVTVSTGQTLNIGQLNLARAAIVTGTIVSTKPGFNPAYAFVKLMDDDVVVQMVQAGPLGEFSFDDVAPGTYTVELPDSMLITNNPSVTVTTGATQDVTLQVLPGGVISGVVSAGGTPLPGVHVSLQKSDGTSLLVTTDETGVYRAENLHLGSYTVFTAGSTVVAATVTVLDGTVVSQDLAVNVAGTISGRLTAPDGKPIQGGVRIYQNGKHIGSASANSAGDYVAYIAEPGTYDLVPESSLGSFAPLMGVVLADDADITHNFVAGTGSLQLNVGGGNVEGTIVSLRRIDGDRVIEAGYGTVNASGNVRFENLVPGVYRARLRQTGNRGLVTDVTVSGATVANASLVAQSSITGTVTTSGGAPIAGARVYAVPDDGGTGILAVADDNGVYTVRNLPAGIYNVTVFIDGKTPYVQLGVNAPAGASVTISPALADSTTQITGRIVDSNGVVVPGGQISVTNSDGTVVYAGESIGSDGLISLNGVVGTGLTITITALGGGSTVYTGQSLASGNTLALGDVVVQPLMYLSRPLNPPEPDSIAYLATHGTSIRYDSAQSLDAPAAENEPGFIRNVIDLIAGVSKDPNHVLKSEIDDPDECNFCYAKWVKAINAVTIQDNLYQLIEEYRDHTIRELRDAMISAAYELTQVAGYIASAIIALNAAAVMIPSIGTAIGPIAYGGAGSATFVLGAESVGGLAVSGGFNIAFGLAQSITALQALADIGTKVANSPGLEEALEALNKTGVTVTSVVTLLGFVTSGLMEVLDPVTKGGVGADAMGGIGGLADLVGLLLNANTFLERITFTMTRDALSDAKAAFDQFTDVRNRYRNWVTKTRKIRIEYLVCLKNAPQDCDGTNHLLDLPLDALRFVGALNSLDPNDITGPIGFGPQKYVPSSIPLDYTIRFENDATATAPAQVVSITQSLDSNLDARTFRLGDFGFSGMFFDVPANSSFYQTRLDLVDSHGIYLDVAAGVDLVNNQAFWRFISIDPDTGDVPTNPLLGFLPINITSPEGEGFVQYTIRANSSAQTGDVIDAMATIVFDDNAPIDTPAIFNTLDVFGPVSSVDPLPAVSAQDFVVYWNGDDDVNGSAIATFDVYVSTNSGAYELWLDNTDLRQGIYTGVSGNTYAFYSVAVDNVGNVEAIPPSADATTTVGGVSNTPPTVDAGDPTGTVDEGAAFARNGSASDVDTGDVLTAQVDYGAGAGFVPLTLNVDGTFSLSNIYADNGIYTVTVRVQDQILATTEQTIQVTVNNVNPTIAVIADQVVSWDGSGGTFTVGGSFADPGADTFTGEINYGSGFVPLTLNPDGTFSLTNRYTTPGLYPVTVRISDDDTGVGEKTFNVRLLPPPPKVSSIVVNGGGVQRSMVKSLVVTFDNAITALPETAITILLRSPSGPLPVDATLNIAQTDVDGKVWTITFSGAGLEGGSLADGVYDITINQEMLTDAFAQTGAGVANTMFHRLFGDGDGDRDTDNADLVPFRRMINKPASYVWYFDADSNGSIDNNDYATGTMRLTKRLFA